MLALLCAFLPPFAAVPPVEDYDKRAREIVSMMTLDEKLTELHGIHDATHNRYVPGIPRHGIPELRITNGPAGAGPDGAGTQAQATALPAPISLAATWDPESARRYGSVVGGESRLLGNGLVEAPTINIARVPENGRTFEGYGEDPYLSGTISAQNIIGIQSEHIIADVKHYAANNQETDRRTVNEEVDERALREIYLPAFEASIKDGGAGAVMCAYPSVNGTFCCEHAELIGILKKEWGFAGFVTSDFHAVHSSAASALAGLDLEMPTGDYFSERLKKDIQSGKVPLSAIDDKLVRRFRTMMELGVWSGVPVPSALPAKQNGAISRQLAEEGMVLLKNDGLLPLKAAELKSVALIGLFAEKAMTGGGGSSHVRPLYTIDPPDGIRQRLRGKARLTVLDGSDLDAASAAAKAADVAIVMIGDRDREGHDQPLAVAGNQDALVESVIAANRRTVVVLKTGSAVLLPWADAVPALLEAWYPGEEDGNAVAAVLFGEANPSGKLPLTFPRRVEDTFAANRERYPGIRKVAKYTEGIYVGYRYYDEQKIEPLFPFGFGLSYTRFALRNLRVSPASSAHTVQVEFDVINTGPVAGAEVAQVYVAMPSSAAVPQPPRQLKAFQKVRLDPGKSSHVTLTLNERAFQYWDGGSHAWKTARGTYGVMVGSSSRDLPLRAQVEIRE
jgi:beta-glucosidase